MEEWGLKVLRLEREHGEKISDRMRMALLLSMVPDDLQDLIYQQAGSIQSYDDARGRLKGIVQNRVMRSQATPMDIGRIGSENGGSNDGWDDEIL